MYKTVYEVRKIDAWLDADGGYYWNDSLYLSFFKVNENANVKRAFLRELKKLGIICKRGACAVVSFDGGFTYELQERKTGAPLYACIVKR